MIVYLILGAFVLVLTAAVLTVARRNRAPGGYPRRSGHLPSDQRVQEARALSHQNNFNQSTGPF